MTIDRSIIDDVLTTVFRLKKENSPESYISIKNAFKLFSIPIPVIPIPKGYVFYRIRVHSKNEASYLFNRVSDLGHRVDRNGITNFGRANEPFQSMFYCSDSPKTAFCETSKLIRKDEIDKTEVSSLGIWRVTKDINVAYLPKSSSYSGNMPVELLNKNINSALADFNHENSNNLKYFLNAIADEFSNSGTSDEGFNYLLTCAFANYIYETPMSLMNIKEKINIDGIAYPSVQLKTGDMNFSLKPELIETKDVVLEKVIYRKMQLISENTYVETTNIISESIDYNSDLWSILWG